MVNQIVIKQHRRRKPSGGFITVKRHTRMVKGGLGPVGAQRSDIRWFGTALIEWEELKAGDPSWAAHVKDKAKRHTRWPKFKDEAMNKLDLSEKEAMGAFFEVHGRL